MITIAKKTSKSKSKKTPSKSKKTSKPKSKKQPKPKKSEKDEHVLIPKHIKLSDKEKKQLFEDYNIGLEQLPRIFIDDPGIKGMNLTTDDVVRVERPSPTAKTAHFYRRVVK